MRGTTVVFVLVLTGATALAGAQSTEHWPRFRGTQAGVADDDPALPDTWSRTENVAWSIDLPGQGWSSPVIWGDHVFLTSAVSSEKVEAPKPGLYFGGERPTPTAAHRWMLYDIDFGTGRIRWEREVKSAPPAGPRHLKNTFASETPVTDGERVYAYFGNVGLFAFEMDGTPVWSKDLGQHPTRFGWGTAASPVLHDDRIIVVNDNDGQSFIAAFDTRSGEQLWRVDRDEGTNWATPFVWEHSRGTEIVTSGTGRVRSYDLDGQLLWELRGMSSIAIPTPFEKDGLLYVSSGYVGDALRPLYAIRAGARGDISLRDNETRNDFVVWSNPQLGTYNTTAVAYEDTLYTLLDRGFLLAHDARTGQEIYGRQRVSAQASGFTASPWAYNGRVFALSEDGDTFVIKAGPTFELLGTNSLGEMTMATPAIARGSLLIRTASKLYRIAKP